MVEKIRVLVKNPGQEISAAEIENSLGALQAIVGGYIETVTLATDMVIICNEEGRLIGLPFNCEVLGCGFVGPVIFASTDGEGNFVDITPSAETVIGMCIADCGRYTAGSGYAGAGDCTAL